MQKPRIFISYTNNDESDKELATYLAKNLEIRGAEVVKAPEGLRQGEPWRPQLKEAIANATHFLVILSAGALQSDEVCDEIRQARQRAADGLKIMQVRTGGKLRLPEDVTFLNDYHSTPYGTNVSILEEVSKTLELRPQPPLKALASVIEEKTKDFVGRDYVFKEIDDFLENNVSGYFTVVADPGMGKSSVLAEFTRRRGCVAHFNIRQEGITSAAQFLNSVCTQLITIAELPYFSELKGSQLADGAFLQQVLSEALEKLHTPIVIAVDALDEVDVTNHPSGANILFLPNTLPSRVYFIVTRRPMDNCMLDSVSAQYELNLMDHPEENKADIEAYVRKAVTGLRVQEWIGKMQLAVSEVIGTLVERSQSNFMYIVHVLRDIESGMYKDRGLEQIPKGLRGYYSQHWERMGMNVRPAPLTKVRIIGTIAAARKPLSRKLITRIVATVDPSVDEIAVAQVLEDWKQFLHESEGPVGLQYSVYHASFLDFLYERTKDNPALPSMEELRRTILRTMTQGVFGGQ